MNHHGQRLGDYFTSRRERGADGLPTLSVTLDRGLVRRDSLDRKTDTNLTAHEHLRVRPGDIAYNMMRMWQGASGLAGEEALVSPAYVVLAPRKNLDPLYASYLFKLPEMIHRFWAYSYGLTEDRLRLYFNDFKRIPCAIPPLPEQRKIAEILSTWDRAIETTEALLAAAKAQKRALMQTLLTGKRRFPEFEGQPWREVRLGEIICALNAGTSVNSLDVPATRTQFGVLKTSVVSDGYFRPEKNKAVLDPNEIARLKEPVSAGTIIISRMNTPALVGANGYVAADHPNLFLPDRLWALKPKTRIVDPAWLGQLLASEAMRYKLSSFATGTSGSMKNITKGDVASILVSLPSLKEQIKISESLSSAECEVTSLRTNARILRTEKSALMQQLLTGKRRVRV